MLDIKKIESAVIGKTFIEKIYFFNEIDSTNIYAKTLNDENNVLVLTNFQKKGKGRFDRNWTSDKDTSLTFTIKKHFNIGGENIQSINYFSSYCVFEGLKKLIHNIRPEEILNITIKWPNDILLNEKKLCGLLIENNYGKNDFIIGIGINVNQELFSSEIKDKAISLKNYIGYDIDTSEVLINILDSFNENLYLLHEHDYDGIFKLWKANNDFMGKHVIFTTIGNLEQTAQVIDFIKDGSIKLNIDGNEYVYYSGDIRILKIYES